MVLDEVSKFIARYKLKCESDPIFKFNNGNGYYFATILKNNFDGEIYFVPSKHNFVCKISDRYYNINGEVYQFEKFQSWHDLEATGRVFNICGVTA